MTTSAVGVGAACGKGAEQRVTVPALGWVAGEGAPAFAAVRISSEGAEPWDSGICQEKGYPFVLLKEGPKGVP